MNKPIEQKTMSPEHASHLAARLAAVQGLYEISYNKRPMRSVVEEMISKKPAQGDVAPNAVLLKRILFGVEERGVEMDVLLKSVIRKRVGGSSSGPEPLLKSGILCAMYELMVHDDIDAPIIISDYLTVMRGFYGSSEVGFVNGILDTVAKSMRDTMPAKENV